MIPGTVANTVVETTHLVLPGEANTLGTAFGGNVCAWIDLACAVSAQRHCRLPVATASIDDLHFLAPIKVGHVAIVRSHVNAVFRTSLEVEAIVHSEDPLTGERSLTTRAFLTFVALSPDGEPLTIAPLTVETDEERERQKQAHARRAERLARKRASAIALSK